MSQEPVAEGFTPEIAKRLIADRLVQYRKACGLTSTHVQAQLNIASAALSGLEQANVVRINGDYVRDLLDLYGVPEDEAEEILALVKDARQRGWYRSKQYRGIFSSAFPGFEAGASEVRTYENVFVPGLFQTPGYVRWSLNEVGIRDEEDITRRQEARQNRQQILTRENEPPEVCAVFDESAILRITDSQVRIDQLEHLINASNMPNVHLQVLRISDGLYPGVGEIFTLLRFKELRMRNLVYLESLIDIRLLEKTEEVESFTHRYDELSATALTSNETSTYLQSLV